MSRKPKATGVEARVIADLEKWMPLISEDAGNDLSRKAVIGRLSDEIAKRQQLGRKKYPTTLARNPARFVERVRHAAEESWDGLAYMQWAMERMETAGFLQWAAESPRQAAWIQQQVISLLTMQRLQACLLTRLLMAAEAALIEHCKAVAKRIPFAKRAHLNGRDMVTKWENEAVGICRESIVHGCPKADGRGYWDPHPRKSPTVLYHRHGKSAVYGTLAELLLASPTVLDAAAKLYPPKGGQDA